MPISDSLLGWTVSSYRFYLRQGDRHATATPLQSNKHLRFTVLFRSHSQDSYLFPDAQRRNRPLGFAAGFKREFQLPLKIVIPTHRPLTLVVRVDDDFHFNSPLARFIFLYTSHGSSLMAHASFLSFHIPGATRILNFRCVNLKRIQRSAVFSSGNGRFGLGLT